MTVGVVRLCAEENRWAYRGKSWGYNGRDSSVVPWLSRVPENAFLPIAVWLEVSLRCSGFAGARPDWDKFRQGPRNLLGAKAPTLQIGEEPPKML